MTHKSNFPQRKTDEARRVDEELLDALRQLLQDGEDVSVRAAVRRMRTISQPSTITRDLWRMAQVTAHQTAQGHIRSLGEKFINDETVEIPESGSIADWSEFRRLRCFVAAVRTGNLGQAARELNMSQPGVTRQIRTIEGGLGTQLFVRHSRGVTPTVAGSRLFDRLDTIMRLLTSPLELEPGPVPNPGIISIGLPPEVGLLIGAAFVEQAQATWPNVKIEVHSGVSASLQHWVLSGRVEIAILPDPPTLDNFVDQPVVRESLGLVIGPRSRLADSVAPLRFRELAGLPLLLTSPGHCYRKVLVSVGYKHGVELVPKIEIDDIPTIKAMVNHGIGHAILPAAAVQDEIVKGALLYRRVEQPSLSTTLSIVFRQSADSSILSECANMLRTSMISPSVRAKWPDSELV